MKEKNISNVELLPFYFIVERLIDKIMLWSCSNSILIPKHAAIQNMYWLKKKCENYNQSDGNSCECRNV
jgi:hypothetical protein